MINITSYEELLSYAEDCLKGIQQLGPVELGTSLDFTMKIKGEQWDGSIDHRLAKYIIEMQKALNKLFNELDIDLAEKDKPVIKFRVEEGSLKLIVKLTVAVKEILKNMESKHQFYTASVLIMVLAGVFTTHEFLTYQHEQQMKQLEMQQQQQAESAELQRQQLLVDAVNGIAPKISTYQAPTKKFVNMLHADDTITSSINNVSRTKEDLAHQYPASEKVAKQSVYIDDNYQILAVKLDPSRITISKNGKDYDCQSSLNIGETKQLMSQVEKALSDNIAFNIDLQITTDFFKGSNSIDNLIIFQIGKPRKNAQTIDSLLKEGRKTPQISMF